ncbi:MAG: hypothetical protein JJ892_15165 [Balneola sp.]|nr:hypothetical protein [Balneola sp.]MBO6652327.1 hypothetical protein [Balneola sp.]MBO6712917.1 hypothetical protein [Balneola sp.]MBO6801611.1 hypothetical protein [Balneola sp.]MBO6871930.1 hypothetical protein [Balneola sp.]
MDLDTLKDLATLIGGIVLLLTFVKGTIEYIRQGTQKRVELFLRLDKNFRDNLQFQKIRHLITENNPKVVEQSKKIRSDYAGFFELIALMTNTGLIKKEVSCYMFSSDAILCWENQYFWQDFDKSDKYWGMLKVYVKEMKELRPKLKMTQKKYSL